MNDDLEVGCIVMETAAWRAYVCGRGSHMCGRMLKLMDETIS